MSRAKKRLIIGAIILIVLVVAFFASEYLRDQAEPASENVWESGNERTVSTESGDSEKLAEFRDSKGRFSLSFPLYLKASEFLDPNGSTVVLVQSPEKGEGFQIVISPFDEPGSVLTQAMIQKDIPDLRITDIQEVLLGESGRGIAFLSDNPSFAGKSREVWFIYKGSLYQISTYAHLDGLLREILSTWKFHSTEE